MAVTNERIRQMIFDARTTFVDKFIVLALEKILEGETGPGTTDDLIDSLLPVAPSMQQVLFGRKLGDYSGFNRTQLKALFTKPDGSALLDADVDAIYAAAGVTEGTTAPSPFGSAEGTDEPKAKGSAKTSDEDHERDPKMVKSEEAGLEEGEELDLELEDSKRFEFGGDDSDSKKSSGGKKSGKKN
jgi:hypothetical protein